MRTQYCREHLTEEVIRECGLSDETVRVVNQAAEFVVEHPGLADLPTRSVTALTRIKDKRVKEKAIERVARILKTGQKPTEEEVQDLITVIKQELGKTGKAGTPKVTPDVQTKPEIKEKELPRVINQMRDNPPAKPPIESTTAPTTGSTFNIRTRFPMPGTREEILFRQQINDIGRMTRDWMKNPDLAPLIPAFQELRRKAREAYGDLMGAV